MDTGDWGEDSRPGRQAHGKGGSEKGTHTTWRSNQGAAEKMSAGAMSQLLHGQSHLGWRLFPADQPPQQATQRAAMVPLPGPRTVGPDWHGATSHWTGLIHHSPGLGSTGTVRSDWPQVFPVQREQRPSAAQHSAAAPWGKFYVGSVAYPGLMTILRHWCHRAPAAWAASHWSDIVRDPHFFSIQG